MHRALLALAVLMATLVGAACEPARNCSGIAVAPGANVTDSFTDAVTRASTKPVAGLRGPSGKVQGRVHLGPGVYGLKTVEMPDDVRIEIDPGATIRPVAGYEPRENNDWGVFVFGASDDPTSNVTITSGDGCGGPGTPTGANKPSTTGFRGNNRTTGMANGPVPSSSGWNTNAMWVMDLDPGATRAGEQVTGFFFRWAYDIAVENIFSIQNAARAATGIAPVADVTSRTTVMMFDPPDDSEYTPVVEDQKVPHRVTVRNHCNILSPSGQGPNQIRACLDCTFRSVFSHGGVALRVETDGIRPEGTTCAGTGAKGVGFREYARVDGLRAQRIEGAYGNRVAMFTPHCLPNGTATVTDVRGTSMGELVIVADHQPDGERGGFQSVTIDTVRGCGGDRAQEPHPDQNSYVLTESRSAALIEPREPPLPVTLAGEWTWPRPSAPGGLRDGVLPATHGAHITHPSICG